jgi:phage/plasmid-associated DNA primase
MLPFEIEKIIYSYLKDLECLKYKKINEEFHNCNVINKFLDNECELEENQKQYFTHCGRLYSTFQEYCKNNNENCLTKNEFEGILLEKNIKHVKNDYDELGFNVKLINEFLYYSGWIV